MYYYKFGFILFLICYLISYKTVYSQSYYHKVINKIENGDLIFQDLNCGDLCDAIEKVTKSIDDMHFSHLGLVYKKGDSIAIIEAIGSKVKITSLMSFLNRNSVKDIIVIGKLKKQYKAIKNQAVEEALHMIGISYDDEFLYNNQKLYCSEMVYEAFMKANHTKPFFQLEPMTFKDPDTGDFFPIWVTYYKELQMEIPEGKQGINPGGISRSSKLKILYIK